MSLKKLFIVGLFGLTVMSTTQAETSKPIVPIDPNNIVKVWCNRYHCYHGYGRARHGCWGRPYAWGCNSFCRMNPGACWAY